MKKRYERPSAYIEEFTPNEYVAACGESGKVYNFQCNAGRNDRYGTVYLETNGKAGLQTEGGRDWVNGKPKKYSADKYLTSLYHACDTTHKANSKDEFRDGYYLRVDTLLNVIVWRGEDGNNVHCTTNLNINEWSTAKS